MKRYVDDVLICVDPWDRELHRMNPNDSRILWRCGILGGAFGEYGEKNSGSVFSSRRVML